jgi:hypothetical protein
VEVCTPVSETGRAGALPAAAATDKSETRNSESETNPNAENRVQKSAGQNQQGTDTEVSMCESRFTHHASRMNILTKATVLACPAVASERRRVLNRAGQSTNTEQLV